MNQPERPNQPRRPHFRRPKKPQQPPKGNYAFIDSQNLNLGVQKVGWKMDWHKFRIWLAEKYGVTHAYMFIGYMAENESLYELMHEHGYLVALKPTLEIKPHNEEGKKGDSSISPAASAGMTGQGGQKEKDENRPVVKGNIDADLVLYAMKELPNYDKAVIVSGDGDFFGLIEYLAQQGKLLKVLTPNQRYSTLLKDFGQYIEGLDGHRKELAYHDRRFSRKSKV